MSFIDNAVLFENYENGQLRKYDSFGPNSPKTYAYNDLPDLDINGVPIINRHIDGKLYTTFAEDSHALIIGATRSGKTTGFIIPMIWTLAKQKVKKSFVVTDIKSEIFRSTSAMLKKEGYRIILLNFRDSEHSDYWNPLTPIFRLYRKRQDVVKKVKNVSRGGKTEYLFEGTTYKTLSALTERLDYERERITFELTDAIEVLGMSVCPTYSQRDPYWEDCAREVFKGVLWGLLEDSDLKDSKGNPVVTEDNFSFRSVMSVLSGIGSGKGESKGLEYFSNRKKDSKALSMVYSIIIDNAENTKACILSALASKMAPYKEANSIKITGCNNFELDDVITGDQPVALFISCRDEIKSSYQTVQLFISRLYIRLIEYANKKEKLALDRPFYFILDEFGNFPRINDFGTVISACGGRNIWLFPVLQSYAQLESVYGKEEAGIIRDNLNIHMFFGTNNPETKRMFSDECGIKTVLSPVGVTEGSREYYENGQIGSVPVVPVSELNCFKTGECIITMLNSPYVLRSMMERSYTCPEYDGQKENTDTYYVTDVNAYDKKYAFDLHQRELAFMREKRANDDD